MASKRQKVRLAMRGLGALLKQGHACPFCKSTNNVCVDRKRLVVQARHCSDCELHFRVPLDEPARSRAFYETEYQGFIATDLPTPERLTQLLASDFKNSEYFTEWYSTWLSRALSPPAHVLDFGAAWGYADYQFRLNGYTVEGFELSERRARFGRDNLGIEIHADWESLFAKGTGRFDAVFTAHTMEHVWNLSEVFEKLTSLVRRKGKLILIVPNGGSDYVRENGISSILGVEHIIAFTPEWLHKNLKKFGWSIDHIYSSFDGGVISENTDGKDLYCIATRT